MKLISSPDGFSVFAENPLPTGELSRIEAFEIRRERTGLHAVIAIRLNKTLLAYDTFNVGRSEERGHLAKRAIALLSNLTKEAWGAANLTHELDLFCAELGAHWEDRFTLEVFDGSEPLPLAFAIDPYILTAGGTIFFAPPGAGKSYTLQTMATLLMISNLPDNRKVWSVPHPRMALYVNLERSADSIKRRAAMIMRALGEERPSPVTWLNARGHSLKEVSRKVRNFVRENPDSTIFLDSISRAGAGGSLNDDETGNLIADQLNGMGASWAAIAHTPRASAEHAFGCHSADTEVLTLTGWMPHALVTLENKVACYHLETNAWEWMNPTQLHCYPYDGSMVHFKQKSADILVTPTHRLFVKHRTRLGGQANVMPLQWSWATAETVKRNAKLPCAAPCLSGEAPMTIRVGPADLETTRFLQYLGWWLSEGSTHLSQTTLTQAEGQLAQNMVEVMRTLGFSPQVGIVYPKAREGYKQEKTIWQIRSRYTPWFAQWLRENCGKGALTKHFPPFIFSLAPHLRRILFDALMDGDGSWAKAHPSIGTYTTISRQLADEVHALAVSLGIPASLSSRKSANERWHTIFNVCFRSSTTIGLTAANGNMKAERYTGKVYCLTVPTGAYITRRNGKVAITGNSVMLDAAEDIGVKLASERRGDLLGISLTVVKANDIAFPPPFYYALEFGENGQGLISIRKAKATDFPELALGEKDSPVDRIIDYLLRQGEAITKTIAADTGIANASLYLHNTKFFQAMPKRGVEVPYRLQESYLATLKDSNNVRP